MSAARVGYQAQLLKGKIGHQIINALKMELSHDISDPTSVPDAATNGSHHHHDTHALPPAFIQKAHWHYSSVKKAALDLDEDVIDFRRGLTIKQKEELKHVDTMPAARIATACQAYKDAYLDSTEGIQGVEDVPIYEHNDFPGMSRNWMLMEQI